MKPITKGEVVELTRRTIPRAPSALEERLWWLIRTTRLPLPEREYRFHKVRKWRFDFCWPDRKLAAECEGGSWIGGRHLRPLGFEEDCEKYNTAALEGWTVLRFTKAMINDGRAIAALRERLCPSA